MGLGRETRSGFEEANYLAPKDGWANDKAFMFVGKPGSKWLIERFVLQNSMHCLEALPVPSNEGAQNL